MATIYRTDIGFHEATAENLSVASSVSSNNGTHWARIACDHVDLSFFTGSDDESVAVLLKLREAIDTALANVVVPVALREAA